jgi:sodium/proline symporter
MQLSWPTLTTFLLYLVSMLAIGVYAWQKTADLSDYILGGRKLSGPVAALSAGASDMSGWLLLGLPGAIYAGGLREALIGVGLVTGAYLNWLVVAPRLRVMTEVFSDSLTLSDYLENRFDDESGRLRLISAVVILVFFTVYTASGLAAGAKLFTQTFGMNYEVALWLGAAVIVSYTFIGGFLAVSWTDFVQGTLMLIALILAPVGILMSIGGWESAWKVIAIADESRLAQGGAEASLVQPLSGLTLVGALSLLAWGFGYVGQPHILARFMATRDLRTIAPARRIAMGWMTLALLGSMATGFFGIAYFQTYPDAGWDILQSDPEKVFILLTQNIFNPWVAGALLAAILAAVMSTADSQLLVCSSVLTEDLYRKWIQPDAEQRVLVWAGRAFVALIAVIAGLMASDPEARVLELVSYAWAGLGSAFGPVVLMSVLWRRMTREGALAGMVAGAVTVVVWKQWMRPVFDLYEMFPAFLLALLAIVVVSFRSERPGRKTQRLFEEAQRQLEAGAS